MRQNAKMMAALPRQLQMRLVMALDVGDQAAVRQAMLEYPDLGDAIASFVLSLQILDDPPTEDAALDSAVDRGMARGLARLDLTRAFKTAGVTKPQAARHMRLGVDVLNQIFEGRITLASIPERFFTRLATALQLAVEDVQQAVAHSFDAPQKPAFRRGDTPASIQDFADAVRHSANMTDAERAEW